MTFPIPDTMLEDHIAALGKTGSGKTSTTKLIVEHVVAQGYRVCVLDPIKSDWWGLTSSADGKKPGLPFSILGGPHGHVPLHAASGKAIGQLVGSGKLPHSIIDMADFEAGGLQKFFVDFAQSLMRNAKGITYLVMEEAHEFAPKERAGFGAENMTLHYAKKLATAGRSKGIRLIVATQRVQSLHNAVLGSCETLIAHRLTTPADQEPVLKWLKVNGTKEDQEKVASTLSSLPTGTGWVCSGQAKVFKQIAFPKFTTYDNSVTPTKDGHKQDVQVETAKIDQDQLRAIIGDAAKEALANDPKALKDEISRLKGALAKSEQAKGFNEADVVAQRLHFKQLGEAEGRKAGFHEGFVAGWKHYAADAAKAINGLEMPAAGGVVVSTLEFDTRKEAIPQKKFVSTELPKSLSRVNPVTKFSGSSSNDAQLPRGERAILVAAAQFGSVGREQLSVLTGFKRSTRDAYIQRLREKGFLEINGQEIRITSEGQAALPSDFEPLPTGRELQGYWLNRLPEGEGKILQALIDVYPNEINRSDLDAVTGFKRSTRDAYIQRINAKRLVSISGSNISASEDLF